MTHPEQLDFIAEVKQAVPEFFTGSDVVEFGSLNINGTVRGYFDGGTFTGIDHRKGRDVDVVSIAHAYDHGHLADVVISTEMLEHDPYAAQSVSHMLSTLRPGGLLVVTCAGPDRPVHCRDCGPRRHYGNISIVQLALWLEGAMASLNIMYARGEWDLYCWGIKAEPGPS